MTTIYPFASDDGRLSILEATDLQSANDHLSVCYAGAKFAEIEIPEDFGLPVHEGASGADATRSLVAQAMYGAFGAVYRTAGEGNPPLKLPEVSPGHHGLLRSAAGMTRSNAAGKNRYSCMAGSIECSIAEDLCQLGLMTPVSQAKSKKKAKSMKRSFALTNQGAQYLGFSCARELTRDAS